jgi:hypothetical protein
MSPEASAISAFFLPARRERYLDLVETTKGRATFIQALAHFDEFDPLFKREIPSSQQTPDGIESLLRSLGATDSCRVISEASALDGSEMQLGNALRKIVGYQMGTILSCVPGHLAYYEGEGKGNRFILYRRK